MVERLDIDEAGDGVGKEVRVAGGLGQISEPAQHQALIDA